MIILEKIEFRELVELFLTRSIYEIKSENETPNINFKFGEDGFILFKNIVDIPYVKEGYWTPNAEDKDINFIHSNNNNDDVPTIYINDSTNFFEYLTNIINSLIELNSEYGMTLSSRNIAMHVLRRIWLRMGIEDVANIESFLEKQLQFTRNRLLDTYGKEKIISFNDYEILMRSEVNQTWDETTRSMIFTMKKDDDTYELPHILYDIDDDGVCYIYAVQSSRRNKNKSIERELYKINKNIDNPNVHPSKVYSMLLFINELKKKKISKIRVPSMQILSYRYHELLSEKAKKDLEKAIKSLEKYPEDERIQREYEYTKEWYNHVYGKQDKISHLKTTELINLIYRITEHDQNIEVINDVNIQGDYLGIKIK